MPNQETEQAKMKALSIAARGGAANPLLLDATDFRGVPEVQPTPPKPVNLGRQK